MYILLYILGMQSIDIFKRTTHMHQSHIFVFYLYMNVSIIKLRVLNFDRIFFSSQPIVCSYIEVVQRAAVLLRI